MSIETTILDGFGSGKEVGVSEEHELRVTTERRYKFDNETRIFFNSTYGVDMNQNAGTSGTPLLVHDGTDTGAWTFSEPAGTRATEDSTDQAVSPTHSVLWDNGLALHTIQFDKGSTLDTSNYVSITMAIYVDKDWSENDNITIYGWDTATAQIVGNSVDIRDYFNESVFGVWQNLSIPLGDMGLAAETIDALRMSIEERSAPGPKFYMDDIRFEESGTPIEFRMSKGEGKDYYARGIRIVIADNIPSTLADGTMPGLSYDAILGVAALSNGIVIKYIENGKTNFSTTVRQLSDFMLFLDDYSVMSDGTNTFLTLVGEFSDPIVIQDGMDDNYISFTINDDLSGLLLFRAIILGADRIA